MVDDNYTGDDNSESAEDIDAQIAQLNAKRQQRMAEDAVANQGKTVEQIKEKQGKSTRQQAELPVPGVDYTQEDNRPAHLAHVGDGSPEAPHNIQPVNRW